jgi:hypothetical protein
MKIKCARRNAFGDFEVIDDQGKAYLVPDDPANVDRHALDDWVKAGNDIAEFVAAPPTSTALSLPAFMQLFTASERDAVVGSADSRVRLFLLMASGEGQVVLSDPATKAALDLFVSLDLVSSRRVEAVIAGKPPC